MIGTHDSYTYLKSTEGIYNTFSWSWRTQDKSIQQQYAAGVRYFDIRVREDGKFWRVCHGVVDLDKRFASIQDILVLFSGIYKDSLVRLILEKGPTAKFESEINKYKDLYPCLAFSCIKDNWKILVNRDPSTIDYCYVPWHSGDSFWENIKHLKISTIKSWAKSHNPVVSEDLINSNTLHFMDYAV